VTILREPVQSSVRTGAKHPAGQLAAKPLADLWALVLLSGSLRASGLHAAVGRSIFDLPVADTLAVRDLWLESAEKLAQSQGLDHLPLRLLLGLGCHEPRALAPRGCVEFSVERDRSALRGTGGVVRDALNGYPDDSFILLANAGQLMLDPLADLAQDLAALGADMVVIAHEDGTPSGLSLIRCACLRLLPEIGYCDLKEQALRLIGQQYRVGVLNRPTPTALPIRTLADYIHAIQSYHRRAAGSDAGDDPLAEDWYPSFKIIESGAQVHPTARIHDSVILAGGVVEKGATVVRSVVCPGGVAQHDSLAVDRLVVDANGRGHE